MTEEPGGARNGDALSAPRCAPLPGTTRAEACGGSLERVRAGLQLRAPRPHPTSRDGPATSAARPRQRERDPRWGRGREAEGARRSRGAEVGCRRAEVECAPPSRGGSGGPGRPAWGSCRCSSWDAGSPPALPPTRAGSWRRKVLSMCKSEVAAADGGLNVTSTFHSGGQRGGHPGPRAQRRGAIWGHPQHPTLLG